MENASKRKCIDLTKKPVCCPGDNCSLKRKMCIRRYFISPNAPLKPLITKQKIFDSPRDKISIKKEIIPLEQNEENDSPDDVQVIVFDDKYDDPGKWPVSLTRLEIDHIVGKGPIQTFLEDYPLDGENRCFSNDLYTHKSKSRTWLVYSVEKDAAFCFVCKLFSSDKKDDLCKSGLRNWRLIRSKLIKHNSKAYHVDAFLSWSDRLDAVLKAKPKIDKNVIEL